MKPSVQFQDTALLLMRLLVAAIFLFAGYAKLPFWSGVPAGMPEMSSGMVTLTKFLSIVEPLGAIALIVGFLTRWAATGLGIIMVGAICLLRFGMNVSFFTMQGPGLDYNTLILAGCIVLMAFGGGNWTIDALRKKA